MSTERVTRWETVPLADVLEFREGPGIMARDFRQEGVPLLRLAGLKRGASLLAGCNYLDPDMVQRRWSHFRVRPGDVLLSTSASLGEVAVVDDSASGAIPYTGIICFRPRDDRMRPDFVEYALRAPSFARQIEAMGAGSVMRHFGPLHLRQMTVDVPPTAAQAAIGEVLGAIDDKIAANARLAAVVLHLAVALYERGVSGNTEQVSLGSVGRWLSGGTPQTSNEHFWGGEIPWISAASLKSFFVASSDRTLTPEGAASGTRLVPPGAILFVVRGMSLKTEFRVGVAQREVAFGQDCKAILVDDRYPASTVAVGLAAARDRVLSLVDEAGHGTGRLPTDRIERLEIELPTMTRRPEIEEALSALLARGAAAEEENRRLVELRDTLLPSLMSGELLVRDAEALVGEAM